MIKTATLLVAFFWALNSLAVIESGSVSSGTFTENGIHYSLVYPLDRTEYTETIGGVTYTFEKRTMNYWEAGDCYICRKPETTNFVTITSIEVAKNISIPATLDGLRVVLLCGAFEANDVVETLTFPDTLPEIGVPRFNNCTALKQVHLPNELVCVGGFSGCTSLSSINIPQTVTRVNAGFLSGSRVWGNSSIGIHDGCVLGCSDQISQLDYDQTVANRSDLRIIADEAFTYQPALRSVKIPDCITSIGAYAFAEDGDDIDADPILTNVVLSANIKEIGESAFRNCGGISKLTIPNTIETIGEEAFRGCYCLKEIAFESIDYFESMWNEGDYVDPFCPTLKTIIVPTEQDVTRLRKLLYRIANEDDNLHHFYELDVRVNGDSESTPNNSVMTLVTTNVVVHYVVNSIIPDKLYPASYDTGFVNIITEVKSDGVVSVPATWMINYPTYLTKFGNDFTKSLMMPTGKRDGAGNAMLVWQDYVAGTDPTNEDDVFTASITFDKNTGKPVISWSPELPATEAEKRTYKKYGKVKLTDKEWTEITDATAENYNFFKVTVGMK